MSKLKNKYIVALSLAGIIIYLFARWAKITHQAYADKLVTIGFFTMITAVLLALVKVLSAKKKDNFLNQ